MKVVAYFRRNPDQTQAEAELAVQRRSVATWIEQENGTLVEEFIEDEIGAKARPAFGRARKAAIAQNAVLLVATTKAVGQGGDFSPYSGGNPKIVSMRDPAEVERQAWSRSRLLVLYRRMTAEPNDAQRVFSRLEQDAIDASILPSFHTVLAEFVEKEPLGPAGERPALERALALCREKRARLVIGTMDAIGGSGKSFEPDFTDVPFEVAYRAADQWFDFIPAPENTTAIPTALYFGDHQVRNRRPIYLVNRTGKALFDVTVTRSGWTLSFGGLTQMNPSVNEIPVIDDKMACLAGSYELAFDSDFTVSWRVTGRDSEGRQWSGGATLDRGASLRRLLPLLDWQLVIPPDGS